MVDLCGARMVPGTVDVYPRPAQPRVVPLRRERIAGLLGTPVDDETVDGILDRLGFEWVGDGWLVPPWRDSDVQREADLIEEVARVHGLDKLPTTLPARRSAVGRLTPSQRLRRRVEDLLRDRGLDECISYSFTSPRALERLRLGDERPAAREPAQRGAERDAPAAAARPARRRAPQHRARAPRFGAVRVGARVQPVGTARRRRVGLARRSDAGAGAPPPRRAPDRGAAGRLALGRERRGLLQRSRAAGGRARGGRARVERGR